MFAGSVADGERTHPLASPSFSMPVTPLLCDLCSLDAERLPWMDEGIDCLIPLSDAATTIENAMSNAAVLLHKAIVRAINVMRIGREVRV